MMSARQEGRERETTIRRHSYQQQQDADDEEATRANTPNNEPDKPKKGVIVIHILTVLLVIGFFVYETLAMRTHEPYWTKFSPYFKANNTDTVLYYANDSTMVMEKRPWPSNERIAILFGFAYLLHSAGKHVEGKHGRIYIILMMVWALVGTLLIRFLISSWIYPALFPYLSFAMKLRIGFESSRLFDMSTLCVAVITIDEGLEDIRALSNIGPYGVVILPSILLPWCWVCLHYQLGLAWMGSIAAVFAGYVWILFFKRPTLLVLSNVIPTSRHDGVRVSDVCHHNTANDVGDDDWKRQNERIWNEFAAVPIKTKLLEWAGMGYLLFSLTAGSSDRTVFEWDSSHNFYHVERRPITDEL